MARVVVLGSFPESLVNFRGPLLAEMVAAGHEVHALAPRADPLVVSTLNALGVHYRAIPLQGTGLNPIHDLWSLLRLNALLRQLNPNCLLAYTIKPVIYGSLAARLAGVPSIYSMITGLGYTFFGQDLKGRVVRWLACNLYRLALAYNTRVFFQNRDDLRVFKEAGLLHFPERAVVINGSGVDLAHYAPTPFPRVISFLMIARLLRDKGVYEYVAAARQMKVRFPKIQFRLVGWIDDNPSAISRNELDRWIKEGVVDYLGHLRDVRSAIAETSVYVLPSYHEGMPRSVLEAMAMGRPVITTDAPGCRETVIEGTNGFLVPVTDVDALAEAMTRFVNDPEQVPAMGAASRRIAEIRFDVRQVNRVILETMGLVCEANL